MKTLRLALIGFGAVHQALAHILLAKEQVLAQQFGLRLQVVGVADSRGAVYHADGLPLARLLALKQAGRSVIEAPGQHLPTARRLSEQTSYDMLLEASPVDLQHGEPALSCLRAALRRGRSCVLANKAPLVLDYAGLHALAAAHHAGLAFSATVCGGLPVINVGRRDLVAANIWRLQGIFNSTSNYVLTRMAAGETFAQALAEAQRRGIAEADPALDIDGWDTAAKLVILAQSVLRTPARLADVAVQGIREIGRADIEAAAQQDMVIKLLATAEQGAGGISLRVEPRPVPAHGFLGSITGWQMGIVFETDLFEEVYLKVDEKRPGGTAAAMLRDVIQLTER